MGERVLIVDDDPVQRRLLDNMARKFGYEPVVAESGDQAAKLLTGPDSERFDCVVLDLVMPDLDGLGVLARMREAGVGTPVIVQTAHGGIDNVVSAMRAGAIDFVVKPVGAERLQVSLRNAIEKSALEDELGRIKRSRTGTLGFKDIVTRSAKMLAVLRTAEKAATSAIPVLIEGESGVGKELIARAIHGSGERKSKPFVAVNCGAIPDNLVESILFGHEKGAFTGATERHTGKFIEASGGTLFLDEVGELPPAAQVKLLRAVQEGEVEPVGGRKPVKVDVRLVSATNRNLIADVKSGRFREDLFYRLHVFPISVPPLRERAEDIPELVRHFLARFAAEEGKRIRQVSGEAIALLGKHRWPGNVRPARERGVPRRGAGRRRRDRRRRIPADRGAARDRRRRAGPRRSRNDAGGDGGAAAVRDRARLRAGYRPAHRRRRTGQPRPARRHGEVRPLEEIEAEAIRFAITHYRGQMSEVARRLHIGRSTLYRKLENLGLSEQRYAGERAPLRHANHSRKYCENGCYSIALTNGETAKCRHIATGVDCSGRGNPCVSVYFGVLAASTAVTMILTAGASVASPGFPSPGGDMPAPRQQPAAMPPSPPRDTAPTESRPMQSIPSDNGMRFRSAPLQEIGQPNARVISPTPLAAHRRAAAGRRLRLRRPPRPSPLPSFWCLTFRRSRPFRFAARFPTAPAAPVRRAGPGPGRARRAAPRRVADIPFSDKLRELVANKQQLERLIPRKNERDAVAALYQNTLRFAPLWIDRGAPSERAQKAIAHLQGVDADGLDPADYPTPSLSAGSADALAEAELRFTATVLTYARHAMNGRIHFSRVSPNIEFKEAFEPADALKQDRLVRRPVAHACSSSTRSTPAIARSRPSSPSCATAGRNRPRSHSPTARCCAIRATSRAARSRWSIRACRRSASGSVSPPSPATPTTARSPTRSRNSRRRAACRSAASSMRRRATRSIR